MDALQQEYPDNVVEAVKDALRKVDMGEFTPYTTIRDMLKNIQPSSDDNRQEPIF